MDFLAGVKQHPGITFFVKNKSIASIFESEIVRIFLYLK